MLSSPDARDSKGERVGLGGSQSVAEPSTIWYSRAHANLEIAPPLSGAYR